MKRKHKEILFLFVGILSFILLIAIIVSIVLFASWIYTLVFLFIWYIISIIVTFYLLNVNNRSTNVKLCWIFVIFAIPIIGLFLFFIFGINPLVRIRKKKYLENQKDWIKYENFEYTKNFLNQSNMSNLNFIFNYGYNLQQRPIYDDTNIFVLTNPHEFYSESIKLIREAQEFIHLQYYIISDSILMRTITNELIKKARLGVKVRLIYDWVGSYRRKLRKIIKTLKREGIIVAIFNPKFLTKYTGKTNFRCHRKCLIVDNKKAIYGGSNIGDEYICYAPNIIKWADNNVVITGSIVNTINLIFCMDWNINCQVNKKQIKLDDITNKNKYLKIKKNDNSTNLISQFVESSPNYNDFVLSGILTSIIGKAKKRIWIVTPYFIPNDSIIEALQVTAFLGIDVRIMLPGYPDDKKYILTINRAHYDKLLNAGIKVYEYNGFIHSKFLIVDDNFTVIGTFNMDYRSLLINYESSLLINNENLNQNYSKIFINYIKEAQEINFDSFSKHEKNIFKFKIAFMNLYHPLL